MRAFIKPDVRFLLLFCLFVTSSVHAQLKLGNTKSPADSAAILELESSDKGLLFPRTSSAKRLSIPNPPQGLVLYDTVLHQLMVKSDTGWVALGSNVIQVLAGNGANNGSNNTVPDSSITERVLYDVDTALHFPYHLKRIGNEYTTDFNWNFLKTAITGAAVYIDPVNGSNSNTGTQTQPFKTISYALTNSTAKTIYLKPGFYNYADGFQATNIPRDLKLLVSGAGKAYITTHTPLVYTQAPSLQNSYTASYVGNGNPSSVIDMANLDTLGNPVQLRMLTNLAAVDTTPGSCYYDALLKKLTVHTFNNRAPDSLVKNFLDIQNVRAFGAYKLHAENINFWGGGSINSGVTKIVEIKGTMQAVFINCQFSYGMGYDAISTYQNARSYFKNCGSFYQFRDAFNYEDNGHGFEFYCKTTNSGFTSSDNGSTAHHDCRVVRVGGSYVTAYSRCIQDINNVYSYNLGCKAGFSLSNKPGFAAGATTGNSAVKCWFIECISVGPAATGWHVSAGATAYSYAGNCKSVNATIFGNGIITPIGRYSDYAVSSSSSPTSSSSENSGLSSLPEYVDNTAAVAAGLSAGAMYRTGDVLKIVHL